MTSQYVILNFRSLRTKDVGEFVNIAVLSYDTDKDKPEVYLGFVEDWVSVNNAVGEPYDPVFENLLGAFLGKINTKKALQNSIENSQDSVFLFGDPQDSSTPANLLAEEIAETLHC